jgi:hypothetical protein
VSLRPTLRLRPAFPVLMPFGKSLYEILRDDEEVIPILENQVVGSKFSRTLFRLYGGYLTARSNEPGLFKECLS